MNWKVPYIDFNKQFKKNRIEILSKFISVMRKGNFTLREDVSLFEKKISKFLNVKYVIGVNSGTDALMLSAETSIGEHPTIVVKVMSSICEEADSNNHYSSMRFKTLSSVDTFATSLAKAAVQVANDIDAKAIVAYTETGTTPLLISNYRPSAPIITFSAKDLTLRQMNILWGVEQTKIERFDTTEEMFEIADSWLQTNKNFKKNDKVVIVAGTPPNQEAATNLLRVMKIGE